MECGFHVHEKFHRSVLYVLTLKQLDNLMEELKYSSFLCRMHCVWGRGELFCNEKPTVILCWISCHNNLFVFLLAEDMGMDGHGVTVSATALLEFSWSKGVSALQSYVCMMPHQLLQIHTHATCSFMQSLLESSSTLPCTTTGGNWLLTVASVFNQRSHPEIMAMSVSICWEKAS